MTDQELERLAAGLGAQVARAVDPEEMASKVLARLEAAPVVARPGRWRVAGWLTGLAAAAALLLVVGRFLTVPQGRPLEQVDRPTVLQELDPLSVDQLEELLHTMPVSASTLPIETIPLQELDTTNLERLLRSLEG